MKMPFRGVAGIARRHATFLLALLFLASSPAAAQDVVGPERYPTRAVFVSDRLWIATDSGALFSLGVRGRESRPELLEGAVRDICVQDARLVALTGRKWGGRNWTLRGRGGGGWSVLARVPPQAEEGLIGLGCGSDEVLILTSRRLIEIARGAVRSTPLSKELPVPRVSAVVHVASDSLYAGFNDGEWGGGLRRISRRDGRVDAVEEGDCEGLLNAQCDPVQAIETAPWRPDCVVIAIGLVHFYSNGRLLEVCGKKVKLAYSKAIETGFERDGQAPNGSVAFFGLVRRGDSILAAGVDGLYRVRSGGLADKIAMPRFKPVGNFHVSFEVPGVVLLVTEVNRRASVSWGAPILIAR